MSSPVQCNNIIVTRDGYTTKVALVDTYSDIIIDPNTDLRISGTVVISENGTAIITGELHDYYHSHGKYPDDAATSDILGKIIHQAVDIVNHKRYRFIPFSRTEPIIRRGVYEYKYKRLTTIYLNNYFIIDQRIDDLMEIT